jgi:hypothetical protein
MILDSPDLFQSGPGFLLSGGGRMRLQRVPMTGADWAIAIGAALPITCIIGVFILFTVFG